MSKRNQNKKQNCQFECQSCCEEVAKVIECSACHWTACISCTQQYVLTVDTAQCMSCKRGWDEYFIRKNFSASWITKSYTPHVKKRLMSQERSFLPESQAYVDSYKQSKQAYEDYKNLTTKKSDKEKEYCDEISKLTEQMNSLKTRDINRIQFKQKIKETKYALSRLQWDQKVQAHGAKNEAIHLKESIKNFSTDGDDEKELKTNKAVYNRPCIVKDCRGYLDKKWNCGLCKAKICNKCRVVCQGEEEKHQCDPAAVESVALIEKECKPCPNCDERIFKPYGCDHMFCTACNTGFSWATGKRISDKENTNPFFREYRANTLSTQQENAAVQNRDANGCVVYTYVDVINKIRSMYSCIPYHYQNVTWIYKFMRELDSVMAECGQVRYPGQYNPLFNRFARVKYIAGDIDESELASAAMKQYKKYQFDVHFHQLSDTFLQSLNDWMHNLYIKLKAQVVTGNVDDVVESYQEFDQLQVLFNYFNCESAALAKLFGYTLYKKYDYYPLSYPKKHIVKTLGRNDLVFMCGKMVSLKEKSTKNK